MTFQKTPLSSDTADSHQVITARLGEQLFGMPIEQVQDVFMVESITEYPVPHLKLRVFSICVAGWSPMTSSTPHVLWCRE